MAPVPLGLVQPRAKPAWQPPSQPTAQASRTKGQVVKLNGNLVCGSFKGQTIVAANPSDAHVIAFSNGTRQLQPIRNYGFQGQHGCHPLRS
jgi:hypothetical protein